MTDLPLEPELRLSELRVLLHRCMTDHIMRAEQAFALADEIGEHAWRINRKGYGQLFHVLQVGLGDELVLSITKLFESPDHRYPKRRSIRVLLKWLSDHAAELRVQDRRSLERALLKVGAGIDDVSALSDADLVTCYTDSVSRVMPTPKPFWIRRDKRIAHTDDVVIPEESLPSWDEAASLITFAQDLAGTIGEIFGIFHFKAQDGTYMLSESARRPAELMKRLLEQADLIDTGKGQRLQVQHRGIAIEIEQDGRIWVAQTVGNNELITGVGSSEDEALRDACDDIDAYLNNRLSDNT